AQRELARTAPATRFKAAHDIRRRLKKIRTVIRLTRFSGDHGLSQIDREYVAAAAKNLPALGNSDVNRKTAAKLCKNSHKRTGQFATALHGLDLVKDKAEAGSAQAIEKAS